MATWEITTRDGLTFELEGDNPPDENTIRGIERQIRGEPPEQPVEQVPETSAVGAFTRAAGENVLPSAGGWAGALAGARAGAMIPIPHPYAKIAGGFIGGLLGFLGTSWAQRKVAEKVAPEATKEFEELRGADIEKRPISSFAGSVAGATPFFQFNPMATAREISTLARGAVPVTRVIPGATGATTITTRGFSPEAKQAAVSLGAKLGLGAGFGAAPAVIEGRAPTLREVGEGAAFPLFLGAPRWQPAPTARVVTPEVMPPEAPTVVPDALRLPGPRRFFGTPEGGVIDIEARPVRGLLPGPRGRFVVTPEGRTVDIEALSPEELAAFQRTAAFRGRPQEVPPVPSEEVPAKPAAKAKPTVTRWGRKAGDVYDEGFPETIVTSEDKTSGNLNKEYTVKEVRDVLSDTEVELIVRDMTPDEIIQHQERLRKQNAMAAELGLPEKPIPSVAPIKSPKPPTEEPPPEGMPGVPVEPVPPKTPPAGTAVEPVAEPEVVTTTIKTTGEPTLFSDNPKLAKPVSWWRRFSTVQGAAKMGAKTRGRLIQYTKIADNPKSIADFISKRIGEVEGKQTVSEPVAPVAEPVSQPEKIVATAVRNPNTGQIASGKTIHVLLYPKVGLNPVQMKAAEIEQASGYMTNKGRFVTQSEADKIAESAKQIVKGENLSGETVSQFKTVPVAEPKAEIAEAKTSDERTRIRQKQDAIIAAAESQGLPEDVPISTVQVGAPTIADLRKAIYPDFEPSLNAVAEFLKVGTKPTAPVAKATAKVEEGARGPYKGRFLDDSFAQEKEGYPKAKEALKGWSNDDLRSERAAMVKASLNPMFGGNAKKVLNLIESEIAARKATPPTEPPPGPGGNVGFSAAVPGEFTPPPETEPFRQFTGWAGKAKEVLAKVKQFFTPPQAGDLPEVDIRPDAILPRLPKPSIENKIASSPQGMARLPFFGALADPRARAHDPSDAPFLGRANSISKGKTFAAIWGQTQWANKDLFKVNPETGTMPLTNGKQGYLSDVIEAEMRDPGSQPITINQYRWIHDEWIPLHRDVNKMLREEGVREIHTDDMEIEVGKDYFPRPAIGKRNRPVEGSAGKPGGKPGARQFFQKERKFATEEEGARPSREGEPKEVIIYDPDPISRVVKFISGAYRSVADHRLAIAPELGAGTVPERWGVGRRVFAGPSFQGKVYPVETATKIERAYGAEVSEIGRKAGEVTAAAKAVMATGDLSAPLIQGAAMFGRHPLRWAKSVGASFKALFDPNYVARLMEQPRYQELRARASQSGMSLFQLQDFMSGTAEGQLATRVPGYGRVIKATGRAYGAFLDIAKLELFDAWSKVAPRSEWPRIAETVENSLFSGRIEQIGVNPHRALAERILLFAPSYYRGAGGLVSTAFQKGVSGSMARQMLGGYAASGLLVTLGAYAALGMDEDEVADRMNPAKGRFMKIPVELADGSRVEVGIGNVLTQLVRLVGQAKEYHTTDKPIDVGVEGNPYLRFLRGRAAFMPSLAIEIATGHDFFGNRITAKESTIRHFMPFVAQSLFPREEVGPQQRVADAAFTFAGLNAYPEGQYQENLRKLDRLSYDNLHRPFAKATPAQRSNVIRKFKQTEEKQETTPTDIERYTLLAEQRRRELVSALPEETQDKLNRIGLDVSGYKSTIRVNNQDVPLTESERERLQALLSEEYARTIGRLNEKALSNMRPDVREKVWSQQREQIGIRARRRLLTELNKGGKVAVQKP